MSTHGPQHDEFGQRSSDAHGGATYDEGFNSFAAAHTNAHGKLFDKFSKRPGVDRYGERWDNFAWKDIPSLHGQHYDEGFDSPTFDADEHGQLHDVFRGSRVRYMYGGQDVEGIVLETQREFAVVESREGDRHEVTLPQLLQYATAQGNPHADSKPKEALDLDYADLTGLERGTESAPPQGERPSGESPANGGERTEGGSYDDTVVTHVKTTDGDLDLTKTHIGTSFVSNHKCGDGGKTNGCGSHSFMYGKSGEPMGKNHVSSHATCVSCGKVHPIKKFAGEPHSFNSATKTSLTDALEVVKTLVPFDEASFDADAQAFADDTNVEKSFVGVHHLSTKKLTEAHQKFSDHYTAARLTGSHDRAAFSAQVLAATHAELHARGVMAEKPDEGDRPVTRGIQPHHQPLKTSTVETDVEKGRTTTPTHRIEYHPSHYITAGAWPTKHAGRPTSDNLHKHIRGLEASTQTGGVNAHLGAMKVRGARVVDQRSGEHVAHFGEGWGSCGPHCLTTSKSVDTFEGAAQSQDLEGPSEGANWCKACQHYCRKVVAGKCPTCGGPVGVKKNWADALDVLKEMRNPGAPWRVEGTKSHATHSCPGCHAKYVEKGSQYHRINAGVVDKVGTGKAGGQCSNCGKAARNFKETD